MVGQAPLREMVPRTLASLPPKVILVIINAHGGGVGDPRGDITWCLQATHVASVSIITRNNHVIYQSHSDPQSKWIKEIYGNSV